MKPLNKTEILKEYSKELSRLINEGYYVENTWPELGNLTMKLRREDDEIILLSLHEGIYTKELDEYRANDYISININNKPIKYFHELTPGSEQYGTDEQYKKLNKRN